MHRLTLFWLLSLSLFCPLVIFAAPENYTLLEPTLIGQSSPVQIGDLEAPGGATSFAAYFQLLYQMLMGIGVLACIFYFVWGGFTLMVSTVPGVKENAKKDIYRSLEGLAFILGAYLILNTINPRLTKIDLDLIGINTTTTSLGPGGQPVVPPGLGGLNENPPAIAGSYTTDPLKSDMQDFSSGLTNGQSLKEINIDTKTKKITFVDSSGKTISRDINIGLNGYSGPGEGVQGDNKTPTGNNPDGSKFAVTGDIRISSNNQAVTTRDGQTNLGAAFINIGAKDGSGADRGIGIHGHINNGLRPTNGCIRMKNEDLLALSRHFKPGTPVNIQ